MARGRSGRFHAAVSGCAPLPLLSVVGRLRRLVSLFRVIRLSSATPPAGARSGSALIVRTLRLVILGNLAGEPYPGIAWQVAHFVIGLSRLGHDVYYFETSSAWPYDPVRKSRVNDSEYPLWYLAEMANYFGFAGRWAYRRSYGDKAWFGMSRTQAEELLAHADAVLSITGSTRLAEEGLKAGRLVYVCTDPVIHEVLFAKGDEAIRALVDEHDDVRTF